MSFLHLKGILLFPYLDDILVVAESPQALLQDLDTAVQALMEAGYIINVKSPVYAHHRTQCF